MMMLEKIMPMMIMVLIMKSDIFVQKLGCNKAQEEPAEEPFEEPFEENSG